MTTLARRAAFTITELLVVIAIIVLLMAIAVPAFSSMLASSERAIAENQLRAALAAGRDAAIQSETGDGAAVFFYTPGGRVTIVACISMGRLPVMDVDQNPAGQPREVFVPVPNAEPMQMPKGWGVRGLAAVGTTYDPAGAAGATQLERWYTSYFNGTPEVSMVGSTGWIFPHTSFFRTDDAATLRPPTNVATTLAPNLVGPSRCTFMVRFKMGSGELDVSNRDSVMVFDPVPTANFRTVAPLTVFRADQLRVRASVAPNVAAYVRRVLADPTINDFSSTGAANQSTGHARALFGLASPDTILARPVSELALYEEVKLAAGVRATRVNRTTGTLYGDPASPAQAPMYPSLDTTVLPATITDEAALSRAIENWIEGGRGDTPAVREATTYDARIFTLTRYLGHTEEVKP